MERGSGVDRKGVVAYLAVTFGVTYAVEGVVILSGFRITAVPALYGQVAVMAVMWVPAAAALVTVRWITGEGFRHLGLRLGPWRPYLWTALAVPCLFALIYALTWLLGLGRPDWALDTLRATLASAGTAAGSLPPSRVLLPALFAVSVLVAPAINGVFGLGEELGWRGYLLPALMPLGRTRAYVLVGVIWGLWHAPLILIGFNYPGHPLLGIVAMTGLTTAFGVFLNELRLRHDSSVLAGWTHGVFNSQAYGIWRILFPNTNALLGGVTGIIGMGVWLGAGLWVVRRGEASAAGRGVGGET